MYVFLDPGYTLSYVTSYVAVSFGFEPEIILEPFSVSTLVGDSIMARVCIGIVLCFSIIMILW